MKYILSILIILNAAFSMPVKGQIITTISGTNTAGYNGDGIQATSAQLNIPESIIFDKRGNLYIADYYNCRIRKIDASGIITTFAGTGVYGYSGDGGPATDAQISPVDITIDSIGNFYIADWYNNAIRKINTSGIISTIAGMGPLAYGFGGDHGPATAALLYFPTGVAVDKHGNVYIVDNDNIRIRKIDSAGIITTIAGNGTIGVIGDGGPAVASEFVDPIGISVDEMGNLYIADYTNVRKINTSGIINTIAGSYPVGFGGDGGPATAALMLNTWRAVPDELGNLYIADAGNQRIRVVNSSGVINTIAGTDSAGFNGDGLAAKQTWFDAPTGVAVDTSGNVYIADYYNNRIRKLSINFAPITGNDTVCASAITTLRDSTPGGVWSSSNTGIADVNPATGTVTGIANGTATISYTIGSTSATSPFVVMLSHLCSTEVGTPKPEQDRILYPNPAHDALFIENGEGCEVVVYDMVGRSWGRHTMTSNKETIDISGMEIGVYMVEVTDRATGEKVVRRVVKE